MTQDEQIDAVRAARGEETIEAGGGLPVWVNPAEWVRWQESAPAVDLSALPQVEQYLEIQHHLLHLVRRPVLDLRATRKVLTRAFAHQDTWHAGFNLLPSD